jgi:hypothetical protein
VSTGTVKGRAPIITPVIQNALVGQTASVIGFSDQDGDPESGSTYAWKSGTYQWGTGSTLLLPAGIGGDNLTVTVTPKTDSATTDPDTGSTATSAVVVVPAGPILAEFTLTGTALFNWSAADAYCTSAGLRLPTADELRTLFASVTSSPTAYPDEGYVTNAEMCSVHGWPLLGQCGGTYNSYWSSTPHSPGNHYGVTMNNGYANNLSDNGTVAVACVR